MIDLNIGLDGVPSSRKLRIGNKYENNDEVINFILPIEFENYNKYIVAVIKYNDKKITKVLPVIDDKFYVSTDITYVSGNWSMYLMCRESEIDLKSEEIDISAKNGEHVFISDGFIGIVSDSAIDKEFVDNMPLDTNLHIIYDDLLKLKQELIDKINTPISYNDLVDVPSEFTPSAHNHDDRYYKKEEVDEKLEDKSNTGHKHIVEDITDFPTSMPANGGDSSTVNGHTVDADVPADAKFTDTVYEHPETHPASMITGLPTKVSELENDKKYQTANEVAKAISDLVKLAPDTLNTLEELANALGNDPNFATTIMTILGEKASKADLTTKVDVVAGKMLSSNDFTNELKTKLESLSNYDDSTLKALITSNQSALNTELAKKVTQIEGKQLSTNDYSTAEKNKLASLNNYDDSAIVKQLKEISDRVNGISMSITALSVTDGVLKMSVDVQEGGKQ